MPARDPLPAIRRIDTHRGNLCALDIVGHFTAADLENAYGLLEAAYSEHDTVDLLIRMRNYQGFDWTAVFDERTIRDKAHALRHLRRYALVGGPAWLKPVLAVFGPLTSVKTRHFELRDEARAWAWIEAEEKPPGDP